jgi:hypothetical protein
MGPRRQSGHNDDPRYPDAMVVSFLTRHGRLTLPPETCGQNVQESVRAASLRTSCDAAIRGPEAAGPTSLTDNADPRRSARPSAYPRPAPGATVGASSAAGFPDQLTTPRIPAWMQLRVQAAHLPDDELTRLGDAIYLELRRRHRGKPVKPIADWRATAADLESPTQRVPARQDRQRPVGPAGLPQRVPPRRLGADIAQLHLQPPDCLHTISPEPVRQRRASKGRRPALPRAGDVTATPSTCAGCPPDSIRPVTRHPTRSWIAVHRRQLDP